MRPLAIIVDLDGTLCDTKNRVHHLQGAEPDWKSFYEGIIDDPMHLWCHLLIDRFKTIMPVILVTGRPDNHLYPTLLWLKEHHVQYDQLLMRKQGDYRKDDVVKKEIYKNEIEPFYTVLFTVDDRQQVVDMWRSLGLRCLQCDPGKF